MSSQEGIVLPGRVEPKGAPGLGTIWCTMIPFTTSFTPTLVMRGHIAEPQLSITLRAPETVTQGVLRQELPHLVDRGLSCTLTMRAARCDLGRLKSGRHYRGLWGYVLQS